MNGRLLESDAALRVVQPRLAELQRRVSARRGTVGKRFEARAALLAPILMHDVFYL